MMFWRCFGKCHVTNAELVELLNIPLRSVQRKIKLLYIDNMYGLLYNDEM